MSLFSENHRKTRANQQRLAWQSKLRLLQLGLFLIGLGWLGGVRFAVGGETVLPDTRLTGRDQAIGYYLAGQLADAEKKFQQGLDYYAKALLVDPASEELRMCVVTDLIRLERFEEARRISLPLLAARSTTPKTCFVLGKLNEAFGDTGVAEALYRKALRQHPEDIPVKTSLGVLLLRQEHPDEAVRLLRSVLDKNPEEHEARQWLIKYCIASHNFEEAAALLQVGLEFDPNDMEWLDQMGALLDERGKKVEAVAYYLRLTQTHPKVPEGYRFLSNYYLQKQEWPAAIQMLEALIAIEPENMLAKRNLGLAWFKCGEYDKAGEPLRFLIDNRKADAMTFSLMGSVYLNKARYFLAIDHYRKALSADKELLEAYLGLSASFLHTQQNAEAEKIMQEAEARFSNVTAVKLQYGIVLLQTQQATAAIQVLQAARTLAPTNPRILLYLGQAYLKADQFETAATVWLEALKLDPNQGEVYNFLGYAYAERGLKLDQAVQWLKKALAIEPNNPYYLDSLGWAYYKQGNLVAAIKSLTEAQAVFIQQNQVIEEVVLDHMGEVYLALGNYSQARAAWQRMLEKNPENSAIQEKIGKIKDRHKEGTKEP